MLGFPDDFEPKPLFHYAYSSSPNIFALDIELSDKATQLSLL